MAEPATAQSPPHNQPVASSTTTTIVPVQTQNPLMSMDTWAPLVVFLLGIAGIMTIFGKAITGKISDYKDAHQPIHDNINKDIKDLEHEQKNLRSRQDALESARGKDEARFVKLEGEISTFKDTAARIEKALEKLEATEARGRAEIIESIREISKRDLKP